jgi:hypothetical protein
MYCDRPPQGWEDNEESGLYFGLLESITMGKGDRSRIYRYSDAEKADI